MPKKKPKDKKKSGRNQKAKVTNASKSDPSSVNDKFRYTLLPSPPSLNYASCYSIVVEMNLEDGKRVEVGKIVGRFICRNNIRDDFWGKMQEVSTAATSLAFDIFDRYGTARDEFTVGCKRGTGVWNSSEMKERCILIYENIVIDETVEDTSFVTEMFKRIFDHAKDFHEGVVIAVVQPELFNNAVGGEKSNNKGGKKEDLAGVVCNLDGTSDAKDYVANNEEVSVTVDVESKDDVDNKIIGGGDDAPDDSEWDKTSQDAGEVADVKEEDDSTPRQPIWSTLEARIKTLRDVGFRRIGTSSWFGKAMNEEHPARSLGAAEDYDPPVPQESPSELEVFEAALERLRTLKKVGNKFKDVSDEFQGYSNDQTTKLLTLRGADMPAAALVLSQAKFGCTCGKCVDGFVSPRMMFTLLKQAGKVHDKLYSDMSCDATRSRFKKHSELWKQQLEGPVWAPQPARIVKEIFKSKDFALGVANIYRFVHEILKIGKVPSIHNIFEFTMNPHNTLPKKACPCCGGENISPELSLAVYIQRGGDFENALKGLFDYSAMKDEKAGADTFWWPDPQVKNWDFAAEYHALPRCRNDSEFGFVLNMLCKE